MDGRRARAGAGASQAIYVRPLSELKMAAIVAINLICLALSPSLPPLLTSYLALPPPPLSLPSLYYDTAPHKSRGLSTLCSMVGRSLEFSEHRARVRFTPFSPPTPWNGMEWLARAAAFKDKLFCQ